MLNTNLFGSPQAGTMRFSMVNHGEPVFSCVFPGRTTLSDYNIGYIPSITLKLGLEHAGHSYLTSGNTQV